MATIQQLCDREQEFWDHVYATDRLPDEERIVVKPIPAEHREYVCKGVVAGTWTESGCRCDVDYVRRLIDDEWQLVPLHLIDP